MKSIIIGKRLPFADGIGEGTKYKKDVVDLNEGAITFSRGDTDRIIAVGASGGAGYPFGTNNNFAPNTQIQILQGTKDKPILSPIMNRDTLKYTKQVYTAPVAKDVSFGRNAAGDPATWALPFTTYDSDYLGQYAVIRIYDLSAPPESGNMYVFDYRVKVNDTGAVVRAALIAKIKSKLEGTGKMFSSVAAVTSTNDLGIRFVANTGQNFTIVGDLLLAGTDVTIETSFVAGTGIADILLGLEKNYAARKGYNATYNMREELYNDGFYIDPYSNYNIFVLEWTNPNNQILARGDDPMVQHCIVAIPTGDLYPNATEQFERALTCTLDGDNNLTWTAIIDQNEYSVKIEIARSSGSSVTATLFAATSSGDKVGYIAGHTEDETNAEVKEAVDIVCEASVATGEIDKWQVKVGAGSFADVAAAVTSYTFETLQSNIEIKLLIKD